MDPRRVHNGKNTKRPPQPSGKMGRADSIPKPTTVRRITQRTMAGNRTISFGQKSA